MIKKKDSSKIALLFLLPKKQWTGYLVFFAPKD